MRKREKMNLFSYYNEKISDGAWDSTFFVIPSKNLRIHNETKIKFDNNEKREKKWIHSLIIMKKYPTVHETPLFLSFQVKIWEFTMKLNKFDKNEKERENESILLL